MIVTVQELLYWQQWMNRWQIGNETLILFKDGHCISGIIINLN